MPPSSDPPAGGKSGEERVDTEVDSWPGSEADARDAFAQWFADWWLRRGRRLTSERSDETAPSEPT